MVSCPHQMLSVELNPPATAKASFIWIPLLLGMKALKLKIKSIAGSYRASSLIQQSRGWPVSLWPSPLPLCLQVCNSPIKTDMLGKPGRQPACGVEAKRKRARFYNLGTTFLRQITLSGHSKAASAIRFPFAFFSNNCYLPKKSH